MPNQARPNTRAAASTPHQTPERDGEVLATGPGPHTAREGDHRQTGSSTSPNVENEVADPHPSDEGDPYNERQPASDREEGAAADAAAEKIRRDIGPNPARHNGAAQRRPRNAGSGPE